MTAVLRVKRPPRFVWRCGVEARTALQNWSVIDAKCFAPTGDDGFVLHASNELPGVQPGETVDYRRLQSLASRWPGLVIESVDDSEPKNGLAAGGKAGQASTPSTPSTSTPEPAAPQIPALQFPEPTAIGGGYTGGRRSIIWRPWPSPSQAGVARARRILTALYEEAVEQARETAPIRWNHVRLALGSRQGRIEQARVWEEQGLPRLLLAVDNSGSIGKQIDMLRCFACEIACAVPWLLVMAAPNGNPAPLELNGERVLDALLDGRNWQPPGVKRTESQPAAHIDMWRNVRWPEVANVANVVGIVYVGDFEDDFLAEMRGIRRASISIMHCRNLADQPCLAWGKEAANRAWPYVVGVGSEAGALRALEIALAEWKKGHS